MSDLDLESGNEYRRVSPTVISNESMVNRILDLQNEDNYDSKNCCINCCFLSLSLLFIFGGIACIMCYIIFGIKFLIEDYDEAHECKGSALWEYVLIGIIFAIFNLLKIYSSSEMNSKVDNSVLIIVVVGIINLGMSLWGGLELWNYSCDDSLKSNLWLIAFITFICEVILAFLCLVLPPLLLIYYSIKELYFN